MNARAAAFLVMLVGCGGDPALPDECRPLDMMCEGTVQYHCAPDVDLIRQGQHVYVWQELVECDDDLDDVLGAGICVERMQSNGLVSAECENVRPQAGAAN